MRYFLDSPVAKDTKLDLVRVDGKLTYQCPASNTFWILEIGPTLKLMLAQYDQEQDKLVEPNIFKSIPQDWEGQAAEVRIRETVWRDWHLPPNEHILETVENSIKNGIRNGDYYYLSNSTGQSTHEVILDRNGDIILKPSSGNP